MDRKNKSISNETLNKIININATDKNLLKSFIKRNKLNSNTVKTYLSDIKSGKKDYKQDIFKSDCKKLSMLQIHDVFN